MGFWGGAAFRPKPKYFGGVFSRGVATQTFKPADVLHFMLQFCNAKVTRPYPGRKSQYLEISKVVQFGSN